MRCALHIPRLVIRKSVIMGAAACTVAAGCSSFTEQSPTLTLATLEALTPISLSSTVGTEVSPPPTVRVKDERGNPMQGVQVFFTVTAGGGTPRSFTSRTDAGGTASVAWTLGWRTGVNSLVASAGGPDHVVFTAAAETGPPAYLRSLTSVRLGIAGTTLAEPLSVRVEDRFGNPVAGVAVTFAVVSGGGTIGGSVAATDSDGIASSGPWKLGAPGENVVRASVPGLQPVTFTLAGLGTGGLAGLTYDLESIAVCCVAPLSLPSRIVFGPNGEFTSYVELMPAAGGRLPLEGHGMYWTSGSVILLKYSGDFLASLRRTLDYWPGDGSADSETGAIVGDAIEILRCWTEDCYDSVWTYRRVAPSAD